MAINRVAALGEQLELIASCRRWTVSSIVVEVLWHDFARVVHGLDRCAQYL